MSTAGEGNILVVGGYGAVGRTVTGTLTEWFPGRVLPAGRNPARATSSAVARPVAVDVTDAADVVRVLERHRIDAVVLCVEPPDDALARVCLGRGVHLVDVGASRRLLDLVDRLHETAREHGATAVLSVGVAPGLTNLLAQRANDRVSGADRLDITVLLGTGEAHGTDAVRWTVAQLASAAPRPNRRYRVDLPEHGVRTAHPFPFSDQYTLRRTLGVAEVTTRLCLDSAPLTVALFGLRRAGAFRLARYRLPARAMIATLGRFHAGGDTFVVRADAVRGEQHAACAVSGRAQSRFTGLAAAAVTRELLTGGFTAGVHHIEQLPELAGLPERLTDYGLTLHWPEAPSASR